MGADLLRQAWGQQTTRNLSVEDGWEYCIFGWTAVMEEVFNRRISLEEIGVLAEAASFARPPRTAMHTSGALPAER